MLTLVVLVFNIAIAVGLASTESPGNCNFSSIPVQDDFNITQFYGSWYEYGRTEMKEDVDYSYSRAFTLYEASNGSTLFTSNEYLHDCNEVRPVIFNHTTTPSRFILAPTRFDKTYKDMFQVSFTDYDNIALVYICYNYKEEDNGICKSENIYAGFLTRQIPMSEHQLKVLNEKLDLNCITSKDVVFRQNGLCFAPTPNPILVG